MTLKRSGIQAIYNFIQSIANKRFNIQTQYKMVKIAKILENEIFILNYQLAELKKYCQVDENGNYVTNDGGGLVIKDEYKEQCEKDIQSINNYEVVFPDIYFTLDELQELNLTLGELSLLEPFIKD